MRCILLFMCVFAICLGSASAQTQLEAPEIIEIRYFPGSIGCLDIHWTTVAGANKYYVRVVKDKARANGKLEYKRRIPEEKQYRRWMSTRDLPHSQEYDYSKKQSVSWCGLAKNQPIKVSVRAGDEYWNVGPKSEWVKFFTTPKRITSTND